MDDSPRSAKRRKLDTPSRNGASTPSQSSTKTPARLSRSAAKAKGEALPDVWQDTARRRKPRGESNGTPEKVASIEEEDIFDDIEGALGVRESSTTRKRQSEVSKRRNRTADELEETSTTPKRGRLRSTKNVQSASRSAFKDIVGHYKHEEDPETDIPDELADAASPSKRTKTPRSAVRKTPAARSTGRKKKAPSPDETEDNDEVEAKTTKATTATPSKTKKRSKSTKAQTEVPDTEDELASRPPPSTTKKALERRRQNFADHTYNRYDVESSPVLEAAGDDDMDVDGNSLLESALDPTEPSPFNKPLPAQKMQQAPVPAVVFGSLPAGRESDLLRTIVMERITGKRPSPLVGLDEEYKSVHQLVEHTVTAGEGNSLLLIGARGSGKTALVNKVLSEVSKDNAEDFHVIRLNGFIHTDDKIALREIWRQLGKEMDVEEDGSGPGKNYADTLQTLLALLSHPSEQTGEHTDHVAKAVIFVMDEFDLFAQHPRQTLLYNLFDIAQSRKAPIAVLGLTTRIDVTNSLEKRVKSRFSHRYVHLSLAKSFTAFQQICKACLMIEPDQLSVEERGILAGGVKTTPAKTQKDIKVDILGEWNVNIEKLFEMPSFLTTHLAPTFHLTKSVPSVLTSFLLPTASLAPNTAFTPSAALTAPDSKISIIPSLSTLALSLLIATARLDIIHDSDTCNFNMAYDEYVTLASKARIQSAAGGMSASGSTTKVWGKDVARREWEGLVELGFIMPVVMGQSGGFGMCRCDVALEEIGEVLKGEKGIDKGLERWCRAI